MTMFGSRGARIQTSLPYFGDDSHDPMTDSGYASVFQTISLLPAYSKMEDQGSPYLHEVEEEEETLADRELATVVTGLAATSSPSIFDGLLDASPASALK